MNDENLQRIASYAGKRKAEQQRATEAARAVKVRAASNLDRYNALLANVIRPALGEVAAELNALGIPARIAEPDSQWGDAKQGGSALELTDVLTSEGRAASIQFGYSASTQHVVVTARVPGSSGPHEQPIALDVITAHHIQDVASKWLDNPHLVVGRKT